MTRIAPPTGETVEATERRAMTANRKLAIWSRHLGLCGVCRLPVPMLGVGVQYDHDVPVWLGGADDDGPNMRPLHAECHTVKTKGDKKIIAKVKRIQRREDGTRRTRQPIKSRGFPKYED